MRKSLLAAILSVILSMPASAQLWSSKPEPINQNDIFAVVTALAPIAGDRTTDVSVYVWKDGSINIAVKTSNGSEIRGRGKNLVDAMQNMARESKAVMDALKPLLPSQ